MKASKRGRWLSRAAAMYAVCIIAMNLPPFVAAASVNPWPGDSWSGDTWDGQVVRMAMIGLVRY